MYVDQFPSSQRSIGTSFGGNYYSGSAEVGVVELGAMIDLAQGTIPITR